MSHFSGTSQDPTVYLESLFCFHAASSHYGVRYELWKGPVFMAIELGQVCPLIPFYVYNDIMHLFGCKTGKYCAPALVVRKMYYVN